MSLIKVAFLGMHYRKLSPIERKRYIKDHQRDNSFYNHKAKLALDIAAMGGLGTFLGYQATRNKTGGKKALAMGLGGLAGGALGVLSHENDKNLNANHIQYLKDPNRKWLVFGRGHLDR